MVEALIFDVDGTLAEIEELHRRAFNETFAAAGLPWHWSRADYRILLRTGGGRERIATFMAERGLDPAAVDVAALHRAKTARYGMLVAQSALALRPGVAALIALACGDEVAAKKPDPAIYRLALARLGLPPAACLAFEDSGIGLRAALAAGVDCIVTPSAYTQGEDFTGARAVLTDLTQFTLET